MSAAALPVQVLLVEDSEDDAFFFGRALKLTHAPLQLVHVADGGEAIEYLQGVLKGATPWPDVVFLDLKLPTRTGFEILEWLRAQPSRRRFDVAVLSGSDQEADVERAIALGANGYFVKPIDAPQLRARLAEVIGQRVLAQQAGSHSTYAEVA